MKPHGLRGEVVVQLVTHRTERLDPGTILQTDRGPAEVQRSSRHQERYLVAFDVIADRTEAEAWRGVALYAEPLPAADDGTLWVHELVGCRVLDEAGVDHGEVLEVQANPASDLLVLDGGALVPLRFVNDGPADGIIHVEVPPGLFELYED